MLIFILNNYKDLSFVVGDLTNIQNPSEYIRTRKNNSNIKKSRLRG